MPPGLWSFRFLHKPREAFFIPFLPVSLPTPTRSLALTNPPPICSLPQLYPLICQKRPAIFPARLFFSIFQTKYLIQNLSNFSNVFLPLHTFSIFSLQNSPFNPYPFFSKFHLFSLLPNPLFPLYYVLFIFLSSSSPITLPYTLYLPPSPSFPLLFSSSFPSSSPSPLLAIMKESWGWNSMGVQCV